MLASDDVNEEGGGSGGVIGEKGTESSAKEMTKEEKLNETKKIADDLPRVSLITSAHNSEKTFFLLLGSFMTLNYPVEKLEWIIIDDGDCSMENLLPKEDTRIKYYFIDNGAKIMLYDRMVRSLGSGGRKGKKGKKSSKGGLRDIHKEFFKDKRLPIGMMRNIACQYSTGELIMHFDVDYLYPYNSVYIRANYMNQQKEFNVMASEQIGAFHSSKMISLLYNDVGKMPVNRRMNDATLCYRKNYWEENKFDNQDIERESCAFLKNRTDSLYVINGLYTTVLILHEGVKDKYPKVFEKALEQEGSNGWHFGKIPDKFFVDITDIDGLDDENIPTLEFTK